MAIRPTDLQTSLITQVQAPPVGQRAEAAPQAAQSAAQAAFVAHTEERNERVAESGDARGNRIDVRDRTPDREGGGGGGKRQRRPGDPFDEVVEDAAALNDDGSPHLIDYTA
jgi:hypothetical protein